MRYQMKQHLFAFGDDYTIRDAQGNDVAYVDGKAFSIGNKLVMLDMQGRELARIEQRLLSWGPTYEVLRNGESIAVLKKHLFTLFGSKFSIDVPGPEDFEASGNFLDFEYEFTRGGRVIASVTKGLFTLRDTYGIDVSPGEDDVLILCCAVIIDQIAHEKKD